MMNKLENILNKIKSEGKDYSDFRVLLSEIQNSDVEVTKNELSDFLNNDFRIQLHTTPNSVAKIITEITNEIAPLNVIDICCGTGNILYYLQNNIDDLTGIEINEEVASLTTYFMPNLKIVSADTFLYPFSKSYDLVVGNLPWGPPVEYNGEKLRLEEAFIRKAFDLCNEKGDIIVVVPYSVLSNYLFQSLRNEFKTNLKKVIGFPSGLIRHSGIKTALLHFNKSGSGIVQFGNVKDLNEIEKPLNQIIDLELTIESIENRWDPEYYLTNEKIESELSTFETKNLSNLAEIINGGFIKPESLLSSGRYIYLKPTNIQEGKLLLKPTTKYINEVDISERRKRTIAQQGDIIISTIFNSLKLYVVKPNDPPIFISNNMAIIRSSHDDYIISYLKSNDGVRLFSDQTNNLRKGVVIPHITISDLKNIKIPILPLSSLNSVGNNAIEKASKSDLESLKELLTEYKNENSKLKSENLYLKQGNLFVDNRLVKIEQQLELLNQKLDTLLEIVKDLSAGFTKIKNFPRGDEDKIFKLCQHIDQKLENVFQDKTQIIENYIEQIKRWLDLWELLDPESQKFLPIAEFIFDELSGIPDADFSPFVVQYCRALENEILKKLFETYHARGLENVDIDILIKEDVSNPKTGKFAKMIKRNKVTYTLGDMNFIMALLKRDGNTLKSSMLLQHFKDFSLKYFESKILEKEFLSDLEKITSDYRNKAAHPNILDLNLAKECQFLLRKNLNLFLESKK